MAISAYIAYVKERQPIHRKEGMKTTEVMKAIATEWQGLTEEEKKPYEAKAEELTAERNAKIASGEIVPKKRKSAADKEDSKKQKKDSGRMKGLTTAYFIYMKEVRAKIVEANKGAGVTDIAKLVGAEWAKLSVEEREKYKTMADEANAKVKASLAVEEECE